MNTRLPRIFLDPTALGWRNGWEPPWTGTFTEWAAEHAVLVGSALSSGRFDPEETPWVIDVLNDCDPRNGVRYNTFVKPVQSGGSVVGELAILCWLRFAKRGDIQYNWESDEKARERWKKRFEKILLAAREIFDLLPDDPTKFQTCLIILDRLNFTMQGVESDANLASDSIRHQVNEEIHNWEAGKLALAYGRTTAFQAAGFHILNISNASCVGDQLHQAKIAGTDQIWEHRCPGCGEWHAMRTRFDENEAQFGGLRYDSAGCKRADGSYDYNKLAGTVRIQLPCGFIVPNDTKERKKLNSPGNRRYSDPRNTGAHVSERSRTLEAVAVHYIDLLQLIKEKHEALKALRYGNPEPWMRYLKERECVFWDPEETPLVQSITLETNTKKNRDGLTGRSHRFYALDRQKGSLQKGEFPHWWLLIEDVGMIDGKLKEQVVFEGKIQTDEDVIAILEDHGIKEGETRHFGVADCTWDTEKVQRFCYQHGINAICARGQEYFAHPGGSKQVFSPEQPLAAMIGAPTKYPAKRLGNGETKLDRREPMFWFYSEPGTKELVYYLQHAPDVQHIVPSDVSKDFRSHMESWLREPKIQTDGSIVMTWRQVRTRDDLYICRGYIAMLMRMAGITSSTLGALKLMPEEAKNVPRGAIQ